MANIKSQIKRIHTNEVARVRNTVKREMVAPQIRTEHWGNTNPGARVHNLQELVVQRRSKTALREL